MKEPLKLQINTDAESMIELYNELPQGVKYRILESLVFTDILEVAERQLQGTTDLYSWDTTGWRHGANLRDCIAKITGIEEEFRKDKESIIKSLEHNVEHYKKYYDWYYKLYRYSDEAYEFIQRTVGLI